MKKNLAIRPGKAGDVPAMFKLIKELAKYEKSLPEVTITEATLLADGFGKRPLFKTLVADINGEVVGMALYYFSYSTWKGKCIYLEDLIVTGKHRGKGIGRELFEELIKLAYDYGAQRFHFQALGWNKPALDFYKKYGCTVSNEWVNVKLAYAQLKALEGRMAHAKDIA